MNIFIFETKKQIVGVALWTLALVLVVWGLTVGVYPSFQSSISSIKHMIESFPAGFAAAFGVEMSNLFNFGGFYNFSFGYLSVMGAIMSAYLGISLFSREVRSKCEDFLFTKPISRGKLFLIKFVVGLALLCCANAVFLVTVVIIGSANNLSMFLPGLSLLLTQLVIYAVSIFCAIFARKVRSVSGLATIIGFGAFIISALSNMLNEPFMRYLDVLKYFEPADVFAKGHFDPKFSIVALCVFSVMITVSYIRYIKRDTRSV